MAEYVHNKKHNAFSDSDAGSRVGLCLVGLGRAGQFHLNSIATMMDKVSLKWVVDVDESKLAPIAKVFGCKSTTKLEEALADESVDAVIVASTTHCHHDHIMQALAANKAILTEKPISHDPKELASVVAKVKDTNKPFMVGFQRRYDAQFFTAREQVQAGRVGTPRVIRSTSRDNPEPPMEYLRISGGIFHDMLCHDFDMLYFMTGQLPESVYSVGHCYNKEIEKMNDIDTALVTFTYKSGLIASVDTSRIAAYGYDQRLEVFGDKGMMLVENPPQCNVSLASAAGFHTPQAMFSFPQRYPIAYAAELADFVRKVSVGETPKHEELDWLVELERVTTAAELSWRLGRKVLISEVDELRASVAHGHNN